MYCICPDRTEDEDANARLPIVEGPAGAGSGGGSSSGVRTYGATSSTVRTTGPGATGGVGGAPMVVGPVVTST